MTSRPQTSLTDIDTNEQRARRAVTTIAIGIGLLTVPLLLLAFSLANPSNEMVGFVFTASGLLLGVPGLVVFLLGLVRWSRT